MKDLSVLREKVNEMATVMHKAAEADEEVEHSEAEMMAKLRYENRTLRELLNISGHPKKEIEKLQQRKRVEEEKLLMNGDITSSEDRSIDSSADEMDGRMDTVKRKSKVGGTEPRMIGANGESVCPGGGPGSAGESVCPGGHASAGKGSSVAGSTDDVNLNRSESDDYGDFFSDGKRDNYRNENEPDTDGTLEKKPERSMPADDLFIGSIGDEKHKQEDLLDLYNSEGILGEEGGEDSVSKRKSLGHESKISGIKFRRSTKQKKVIQADLKSYFQVSESSNADIDDEGNVENDKEDDSKRVDGAEKVDSCEQDEKQYLGDFDGKQEISPRDDSQTVGLDADENIFYNPNLNRELSNAVRMAKLGIDVTGKRIVNINYNFSPPESPVDSPEVPDSEERKHRTVQLDYSDSDSDDAEIMVEDQFDDAGDGSESSSGSSDNDVAGDDEVDVTEEDLIGKLDEGGEFVLSTWTRPANRCKHLNEEEKCSPEEEAASSEVATNSEIRRDVDALSSEFAFTEAYLQEDQFTGGSIEAKFAKRKRYKNGNIASAVTLSPGADNVGSPRCGIRSDSDLTVESENPSPDVDESFGSEKTGDELSEAVSDPVSSSGSDISLGPSKSSSGEIDPTIFMKKLAGSSADRFQSKTASELNDLLSDLDAELEMEDQDSD